MLFVFRQLAGTYDRFGQGLGLGLGYDLESSLLDSFVEAGAKSTRLYSPRPTAFFFVSVSPPALREQLILRVRVDVRVGFSVQSQVCLHHFLLRPGQSQSVYTALGRSRFFFLLVTARVQENTVVTFTVMAPVTVNSQVYIKLFRRS